MESKIRTILVDDEEDSREVLRSLLENYFEEIEIIGEASDVEDAYLLVKTKKPQLVLLDIQMPRGGGFSLLKKFEQVPFEVIFVTSFDKYAVNAIKFSALDYLLKPVVVNDMREAIKKTIKIINQKQNSGIQIINLLHSLEDDVQEKQIAVHFGEKVKLLSELKIAYIEGDRRYCHITTSTGETYTTAKYLKDFEDYFGEQSNFVRVNKSFLINIKFIKEYSKGEPCIIQMLDGKTFETSRRKKQEVLEKLKR